MTLQISDYRMMGDLLVRITGTLEGDHHTVQWVSIIPRDGGVAVISAGNSSSWSDAVLTPVVDPKMIAAAKAFEANRLYEEMDKALDQAWAEVQKWNGVLQCIHDGEVAAVAA
jgi:hypothetical protein